MFSGVGIDTLELAVLINPSYFSMRDSMFPEYRELITKLKTTDRHFSHLFDKHNNLDAKILRMEDHKEPSTPEQIETLKKEKLLLKDQIYAVLKKASAS